MGLHVPLRSSRGGREPGSEGMANSVHGVKHFQDAAHGGDMLAWGPSAESAWRWLQPWRWPVALLAGIVLWLALVAVAGAARPLNQPAAVLVAESPTRDNPFVINNCFLQNAVMPASSESTARVHRQILCKLQTGFTPRP
jgi:hypothetical protein